MSDTVLPGHSYQPDDIRCPKCGHFVGALTRCPNCKARVPKRMSVRAVRMAAIVLGVVGLFLLYLMARHREIPLVRIADIQPMMNFAYVRIEGTVSGDARLYREGDRVRSLRFFVDDGTGEIPVTVYRAQAQTLLEEDRIPRAGDRVEAAGSLSVSADDNIQLRLQVPSQLVLERAKVESTPLSAITSDLENQPVEVVGRIVAVAPPPEGTRRPWNVRIGDDEVTQTLIFWGDVYDRIEGRERLQPGQRVRARATVETHRNRPQLKVLTGRDLVFLDGEEPTPTGDKPEPARREPSAYPKTPIGDITADHRGRRVTVEGVVTDAFSPSPGSRAPHRLTLEADGKTLDVIFWEAVAGRLRGLPGNGLLVEAGGTIDEYKGRLQLKVASSERLIVREPPSDAQAPQAEGGKP